MVELQKLCDKVPCFDCKIAFATIERELGKTVDELFSEITPEPVAAASLGQVYKATVRCDWSDGGRQGAATGSFGDSVTGLVLGT